MDTIIREELQYLALAWCHKPVITLKKEIIQMQLRSRAAYVCM